MGSDLETFPGKLRRNAVVFGTLKNLTRVGPVPLLACLTHLVSIQRNSAPPIKGDKTVTMPNGTHTHKARMKHKTDKTHNTHTRTQGSKKTHTVCKTTTYATVRAPVLESTGGDNHPAAHARENGVDPSTIQIENRQPCTACLSLSISTPLSPLHASVLLAAIAPCTQLA